VHAVLPERGQVGVFNRSHYEDVLVVRVHDIVPESVWRPRYEQIREFEQTRPLLDEHDAHTQRGGQAWFEGADDPVLATASTTEDAAFVRVLLLPAEWSGKRTIRYVDPADEDKPRLQRATVLSEEPLAL